MLSGCKGDFTFLLQMDFLLAVFVSAFASCFTVFASGFWKGVDELVALEAQTPFRNAYTVIDGQLRIDKVAFTGALDTTEYDDLPVVGFMFDTGNYYTASSQNQMQFSTNVTYGFPISDLSREGEHDNYFYLPLEKRGFEELLYLAAIAFL